MRTAAHRFGAEILTTKLHLNRIASRDPTRAPSAAVNLQAAV